LLIVNEKPIHNLLFFLGFISLGSTFDKSRNLESSAHLKPQTHYLFDAKVFRIATNFGIEQANVFCAQKTLAWKPVLQVHQGINKRE
jgi:hypothetical protein